VEKPAVGVTNSFIKEMSEQGSNNLGSTKDDELSVKSDVIF
jgi:hypothetical protein